MKIKELIRCLEKFDEDQEVEICCYTSVNDPDEMVVYVDLKDKNGNTPCQIRKSITHVGIETNGKIVAIS